MTCLVIFYQSVLQQNYYFKSDLLISNFPVSPLAAFSKRNFVIILNSNNEEGFLGLGFNTGRKEIDGKSVSYIRLPKEYYQNILLLSNTVNAAVKGNVDNISVQVLDAEYNPIIPRSQQDSKYTVPLYYNLNPAHNAAVGFGNIYLYNRYSHRNYRFELLF